ncbi:hypothetical protein BGZ76_011212, partial [Entomortierella beljakovae]
MALHEKGKYLLERGDEEKERGNIGKAIKYFNEARKYCDGEAQKRLYNINPQLSDKTYAASVQSSQDSETSRDNAELTHQQFKLTGPYFPTLPVPSGTSAPSDAQLQGSANFTLQDVPSTFALADMFRKASDEEKKPINIVIDKIIQQFCENSNSKEYIQELAVLAAIPDQRIFIAIISQLLKVEKDSPIFPELTIHGLAVVLTSAPMEIDLKERQGLLTDILGCLQIRLERIRMENNNEELLPLLRTITALFDAMLCRKIKHLGRLEMYNPINARLTELASDGNIHPEVSFLARYAVQSLAYIGNDESLAMSIFRRGRLAIGIIADIKSAVIEFDLGVFGSFYEKIMGMSDFSIKMEWYQGLLFLDCLLANDDLSSFEKFILQSKLNVNENFMQGVCLRLEQVVSLHSNPHVTHGAQRLLQDIESNLSASVQITARMVLDRLNTVCSGSLTSLTTIDPLTPESSSNHQQQPSKNSLAPVWDNFWYSDNNSNLLKKVQHTLKLESIIFNMDKVAPTMNDVHEALMDHYSNQLIIQRVTGNKLDLESCYVNLVIVEASSQRKQDEEELKKQEEKFIRMPSFEEVSSTNTDEPIPLEEILDKRKLLDGKEGVPKRILIIGRAGVGKTTFCKKLVHTFQKGTKNEKEALAHEFNRSVKLGRVLFVLDGLDEFVTDINTIDGDPLQQFVMTLLEQPNVIVTTRPYGDDRSMLKNLDLELETVGFNTDNIKQYVKSVVKDSNDSQAVLNFIQQTPLIQGLVNIPIQLDLICYSWKDLSSSKDSTTITRLYQTIVRKLWCSDAIRMKKEIGEWVATDNLFQNIPSYVIQSSMDPMVEFLGYLAFQGLKNNHQLVFDHNTLMTTEEELYKHRMQTNQLGLPMSLLYEVKKSSILHKADSEATSDFGDSLETWNFIHLTFQEYFAANWLSKYFQSKQLSSSHLMDIDRTIAFIRQNKYNPQFEIVWWMIAGQLSGDALESYLQLLQGAPRDLIGARHQLLVAGCYKESYSQLSISLSNQIQEELMQWLTFEMTLQNSADDRSLLGKQSVFPEEVLIKTLKTIDGHKDHEQSIFEALTHHKYLKSSIIEELIQMSKANDAERVKMVIEVLGSQSTMTETLVAALATALQDENSDIREAAAHALGNQSTLSDSAAIALVSLLQDKDWDVREAAVDALGNQSTLSDSTSTALVTALQGEDLYFRKEAAKALGNQSTLSDPATTALVTALNDVHLSVRTAAVKALGNQSTLSDSTTTALITALQHEDDIVRVNAARVLGYQSTLSDSTTSALVTALQDRISSVGEQAARSLGNQSTLSDSTTIALVAALQHIHSDVRELAVKALGYQSILSDSTTTALVTALQHEISYIRVAVAKALGNQSTLSDSTMAALVTALQDEDSDVREAAVVALGKQFSLLDSSDSTTTTIFTTLQDRNLYVRNVAANALGCQSTLSDSTTTTAASALQDENWVVRLSLAEEIGYQSTSSDSKSIALVTALQDGCSSVRAAAARSLGNRSTLSDPTMAALVTALQDENSDVRRAAVIALGNQSTLSVSTTTALVTALQNEDSNVREAAANALGNQSTLPDSTTTALITALQHEDDIVRANAARALGHQSTLLDYAASALVSALQDTNKYVREHAATALGNHSAWSDFITTALVTAVQGEDQNVRDGRYAPAIVSGNQSTLSGSTVTALVAALQDDYEHVRRAAAIALGNQSILSDSTASALVAALQDNNKYVREQVAIALGNQSTLSESTMAALVSALQVGDWFDRREAAKSLGNQSTLSDSTTTVLVAALHDEDWHVRKEAVRALGNQSTLSDSTLAVIAAAFIKSTQEAFPVEISIASQIEDLKNAVSKVIFDESTARNNARKLTLHLINVSPTPKRAINLAKLKEDEDESSLQELVNPRSKNSQFFTTESPPAEDAIHILIQKPQTPE